MGVIKQRSPPSQFDQDIYITLIGRFTTRNRAEYIGSIDRLLREELV